MQVRRTKNTAQGIFDLLCQCSRVVDIIYFYIEFMTHNEKMGGRCLFGFLVAMIHSVAVYEKERIRQCVKSSISEIHKSSKSVSKMANDNSKIIHLGFIFCIVSTYEKPPPS